MPDDGSESDEEDTNNGPWVGSVCFGIIVEGVPVAVSQEIGGKPFVKLSARPTFVGSYFALTKYNYSITSTPTMARLRAAVLAPRAKRQRSMWFCGGEGKPLGDVTKVNVDGTKLLMMTKVKSLHMHISISNTT